MLHIKTARASRAVYYDVIFAYLRSISGGHFVGSADPIVQS